MLKTVLVSFMVIILFSCRNQQPADLNTSSWVDTVKIEYAKGFSIIKKTDCTEVKVLKPWQNAQHVEFKYMLRLDNSKTGIQNNREFIRVPIKKAICLSSTHVAFVSALNELNSIAGISGTNVVYNQVLKEKVDKGEIFEVGYENNLEYEKIFKAKPDVVFAYGVGSESNGYMLKLQELGIPVVMVGEYLEEHPLARTEWIKFFSVFYGKEQQAKNYFDSIANLYQNLKIIAANYKYKPKIMMALPWNGSWYISGKKTYMATLICDAGGEYVWNNLENNYSVPMSIELVFNKTRNADIWINIGQATDKTFIANVDKRLTLLKPYQTGKLFNNNARITQSGGNDYWESGVVHPDIILKDLIHIFHSKSVSADSLYFYKKLE